MKILFTGGSSFTGMWFIRELAAAGHEVTADFRRPAGEYADAARRRAAMAIEACRPAYGPSASSRGARGPARGACPWGDTGSASRGPLGPFDVDLGQHRPLVPL
jgi:nucleoside-diphosphate-sugar epimerase